MIQSTNFEIVFKRRNIQQRWSTIPPSSTRPIPIIAGCSQVTTRVNSHHYHMMPITTGCNQVTTYGSLIYNYLCNLCLSPLTLWVRIPFRRGVLDTTLCDKVCQWLAASPWFSVDTPVTSTNKTDRHNMTEILLKVALNNLTLTATEYLYHRWPQI